MIKLTSHRDNIHFECNIVGYQFPDTADEWCLLRIKVIQNDRIFEKIDPALETMDLPELHNWFNALANNTLPSTSQLWFTEPCISFDFNGYRNGLVYISINLSHELKPDFMFDDQIGFDTKDEDNQYQPATLQFALAPDDFTAILHYLSAAIEQYPKRKQR